MKEAELYPIVGEFIKKEYNCFFTKIEFGKEGIGSIDVFGMHTNTNNNENETVGVEVKIDKNPISTNFGQAKGYSIFCHKVFFASLNNFTEEEKNIAEFLGIGLISIENIGKQNFVCHKVLEPPKNKPIEDLLKLILERAKVITCDKCGTTEKRDFTQTTYGLDRIPEYTKNMVERGKDLLVRNKEGKEFYCNKCIRKIILKS